MASVIQMPKAYRRAVPTIWVVWGDKAGDNAQISTIIEQLGIPVERKKLRFKAGYDQKKPFFRASVSHIDKSRSDRLSAPWPDMIITAGRRPAMAALWVKDSNQGKTKIVLVGRPKRWLHRYDMIVASAQYELPDWPNIIHLGLPLLQIKPDRLRQAHRESLQTLGTLPQPLTALIVGGVTRPYVFDAKGARDLLRRAVAHMPNGGTLYVVTSRRTPAVVYHALQQALPANARLYDWQSTAANPYLGLLSRAETVIVTGDSIAMLSDAIGTGKPVFVYEIPTSSYAGWRAAVYRWAMRWGPKRFTRDVSLVHQAAYEAGWARPLAELNVTWAPHAPDYIEATVERVSTLLQRGD